jgi:signal transduction histidine kinase
MTELNKIPTFKKFISEKLKALNFIFIVVFSGSFLILSLVSVFYTKNGNDNLSIRPIESYLNNLSETNDRIEIQKVLKSISNARDINIVLVKNGRVFSDSQSNDGLDQVFVQPQGLGFNEVVFTVDNYITKIKLNNDLDVYVKSSYASLLRESFSMLFFVLISLGIFLFIYYKKVNKVILESLRPLSNLEEDISGLLKGHNIQTEQQEIMELESIRITLLKTNNELENAKETLASEKAKKLNAEAYKKLIHDLHNPVSSLQNTISAINDPLMDFETKNEIINMIPSIADQLLAQVTSAKKNLEFDSINLQKRDLSECLNNCLTLIRSNNKNSKEIVTNISSENMIIPHDPILLQRAVLNLMENGLEFSKGKVELKAIKEQDYVSIIVSDDGNGMKREDIPIFFQGRGKSSRAERQAFGLSSANHIARIHGGKLIYSKNETGGASFELRLNF